MSDELKHYGTKRHSGRYPWGSGGEILNAIDELSSKGLSEKEIADGLGLKITELRNQKSIAKAAIKEDKRLGVIRRKESGMSNSAIAEEMNIPDATVRDLLKPHANAKFRIWSIIAKVLEKAIEKHGFIDIGEGVEVHLGVTRTKLDNAITILRNRGFEIHYLREPQLGTGKNTSLKVLGPPGSKWLDLRENRDKIGIPNFSTEDGGETFFNNGGPLNNISPSRLHVVYGNEGGSDKDGIIELRRGVNDLSLGGKNYAQVRIAVGADKYLKGMAVYGDNLPPGKDMVFYTNKAPSNNKLDALKPIQPDPDRPFGTNVRSTTYLDENGAEVRSGINIVNEQGDWGKWSRTLSSQFLSKQSIALAKRQLDIDLQNRKLEFDEIMSLTHPVVKQHLLNEFSGAADSASVDLKAAALPRQRSAVLIPAPTLKPNEVYAPSYNNGELVSLVRHPHGGVFEIPTVRVNNKNREMRKLLGTDGVDAIGVHPSVAAVLSGADFDGDTVFLAPNNRGTIRTSPPLAGLKGFEPKKAYPKYEGMVVMSDSRKQMEMGKISNLITDMSIKGATHQEIARAVRHSMVVIDAANHELNYKQSEIDNGIAALKQKYQGGSRKGASTLISRAGSTVYVNQRKDTFRIDPVTGKKIYTETGEEYTTRKGKIVKRTTKSKLGAEKTAAELSSGTAMEKVYVDYSEQVSALADKARLSMIREPKAVYSNTANKTYSREVESLTSKLQNAMAHQPLERKAQLIAGAMYRAKLKENPDMSPAQKKKERGRVLVLARQRLGPAKPVIDITPREWTAIQAGAITPTRLKKILRYADSEKVRTLATPRSIQGITTGKANRAKVLLDAGYTTAEVAKAIGVSQSQILSLED